MIVLSRIGISLEKRQRINHQIRVAFVDMIDEKGVRHVVVRMPEVLQRAQALGLDVVEIAPATGPGTLPLVKIMDYGRFRYEQQKKQKQGGGKQKEQGLKEIRFGYRIDKHDLEIRAKKVEAFLQKGYTIVITIQLRGRELALSHLAKEKLQHFLSCITIPFVKDGDIQRKPKGWSVTIRKQ